MFSDDCYFFHENQLNISFVLYNLLVIKRHCLTCVLYCKICVHMKTLLLCSNIVLDLFLEILPSPLFLFKLYLSNCFEIAKTYFTYLRLNRFLKSSIFSCKTCYLKVFSNNRIDLFWKAWPRSWSFQHDCNMSISANKGQHTANYLICCNVLWI